MARAGAEAQVNGRVWSLLFENGSRDRLRIGGFYAGHESKEDLKKELRRQFWEQEQRKDGGNIGHYLLAQTSASPSPSSSATSEPNMNVVKDAKAGSRRRKVSRGVTSLDHRQGEQHHAQDISRIPVSYSTRYAEKKSKLKAAEKRKLAASEKRKLLAAEKKRKLVNDYELHALGIRRTVTRSGSSNL